MPVYACMPVYPVSRTTEKYPRMVGKLHTYKMNEVTGKLMCPYCTEYETCKQSTMSEHVRQKHTRDADRPMVNEICPHSNCGRSFRTKSLLRNHLASKAHACCAAPTVSTTTETTDATETTETIATLLPVSCEKCGARFAKRGQLISHFVRFHLPNDTMAVRVNDGGDAANFKCTHCSKIMKQVPMTYHVGICNPASPFSKNPKIQDSCQNHQDCCQDVSLIDMITRWIDLDSIVLRSL
jgi:hypothetical protein